MSWLDEIAEPSDAELLAIEVEAGLEAAELALVDAEAALFARPGNATAAAYLQALLDVVDFYDFADGYPDGTQLNADHGGQVGWPSVRAAAGAVS